MGLEIPKFYFSPTAFFKRLFRKNINEKLSISIFYILVTICLTYIFSNDTFKNVTKIIILEILLLLFSFIMLSISGFIMSKIFNYKIKSINIFLFLLITKLFTLPLQIIFIILFNKTEMYELLFIHNTIISLLIFFVILYSSKIFYIKLKQIITASFINLILYNVFMIASVKLKFDEYNFQFESPIFTDKIYKEFDEKLSPLDSLTFDMPRRKYLLTMLDESGIIYSFKKDSLPKIAGDIGKEYKSSLNFELKVLKKLDEHKNLRKNLKFNRNKIMYDTLVNYLNTFENDIRNPIDTSYTFVTDKLTLTTENNAYVGEIKELTMNPKLATSYLSYLKNRNKYYNSVEIADYPTYILQFMLFPSLKLVE